MLKLTERRTPPAVNSAVSTCWWPRCLTGQLDCINRVIHGR